jgi:hypothetical protein
MSAPRLTPTQKNEIIAAYESGEAVKLIAERFNVDPSYPSLLAMRRGLPKRKDGSKAALIRSVGPKRRVAA